MKILLFANTEWYLYNFRLSLAKAIRNLGIEVVMISPPGDYGQRLRDEGFRWTPLPMIRRSLNPYLEARLITRLVSLYRRERPDLVHHFTIKSVVYGSIAARLAAVPHQVNAVTGLGHVFIDDGLRSRLLRPTVSTLLRFALGRGCLILQNMDDHALFVKNKLVPARQIRVIRGSGVNTRKFCPRTVSGKSPATIRVLLATRLLWDKGVKEYVDASRILKEQGLPVEFLLGGVPDDGNPASVDAESIQHWDSAGLVTAVGHIDDMARLLGEVDIVVLPSYREGTPKILLEAAACGLPIVTTDVPGCREVVEHGQNGILVQPRDAVALAEAIRYLVTTPQARIRMGNAGRRKVLSEFDESIIIDKTLAVYRTLLKEMPTETR